MVLVDGAPLSGPEERPARRARSGRRAGTPARGGGAAGRRGEAGGRRSGGGESEGKSREGKAELEKDGEERPGKAEGNRQRRRRILRSGAVGGGPSQARGGAGRGAAAPEDEPLGVLRERRGQARLPRLAVRLAAATGERRAASPAAIRPPPPPPLTCRLSCADTHAMRSSKLVVPTVTKTHFIARVPQPRIARAGYDVSEATRAALLCAGAGSRPWPPGGSGRVVCVAGDGRRATTAPGLSAGHFCKPFCV